MSEDPFKLKLQDDQIKKVTQGIYKESSSRSGVPISDLAGRQIPQEKPAQKPKEFSLPHIRTFESDMASLIKNQNESKVSISTAGHRGTIKNRAVKNDKEISEKIVILIISLILILGTGISLFFFFSSRADREVVVQPKPITTIIPANREVKVVLNPNRSLLIAEILRGVSLSGTTENNTANILIVNQNEDLTEVEAKTFLSIVAPLAPSLITRSLQPQFMLGSYKNLNKDNLFLIIKLDSYENAFAGMLEWEKNIISDLGELISQASSTPGSFKDAFVKNRDVRIYRNLNDETVMLYSFLDKNTVVISQNETTFSQVLNQWNTSKLLK